MASLFFFETLLNTALDGINRGGVTATMSHVGQGIVVATVLYQVYETWWRGADFNELGTVLLKGMLMTTLLANYDLVFHLVLSGFDSVANSIMSHTGGGGDIIKQWAHDSQLEWTQNAAAQDIWKLLKGGGAALVSTVFLVIGYVVLAFAYLLFSMFYLLAGVVLYSLGTLVCALYPSGSLGTYTKGYLKGIMTWGMWPVLYALFSSLMVLIHMDTVASVENASSFLGWLSGLGSTFLIGIVSMILAVAVALIPLLAGSIINGDIGGAVSRVAYAAARLLPRKGNNQYGP